MKTMTDKKVLGSIIIAALAALVAAALAFASAPRTTAQADEISDAVIVTVDKTTYADSFVYDEDMPTTLKSFNVPAGISDYFKVVIPDDVTVIATHAFDGTGNDILSANLLALDIPDSVTSVLSEAVYNCETLLEVLLPQSLIDAGINGTGLTDAYSIITDESERTLKVVSDGDDDYLCVKDGNTDGGAVLVQYMGFTEELTLPAPTVLGKDYTSYFVYNAAFRDSLVTSITVPSYVTGLGERAFYGCTELKSVVMAEGLQSIGASAFVGTAITSVKIPASVDTIGISAFADCTQLANVQFSDGTAEDKLIISVYAFNNCIALRTVKLPAYSEIRQRAFNNCTSLNWVYVGENCTFINNSKEDLPFFAANNTALTIIYPSKAEYDKMNADGKQEKFRERHGSAVHYIIYVNFYVGGVTEPTMTFKRLSGNDFNVACNEATGVWGVDTAYSALPVQSPSYDSTVWYTESELTNRADYNAVASLLDDATEINLYCYDTVTKPVLPTEPATWVYDPDKSYKLDDLRAVLKAMGCKQEFTDAQIGAMKYDVEYADSDSKKAPLPSAISESGTYKVTVRLDEKYGVWHDPMQSTVTVNVDTGSFNLVLILFLVIGALAVAVTVTTYILRRRMQKKNAKKKISSREAIEKYRAAGGETTLNE